MWKNKFRLNGEKGGRPKGSSYSSTFVICGFNTIVLTEQQYNSLINRYGEDLIEKALSILQNWLQSSPHGYKYKGKNNYALFRSDGWLINEAKYFTQQI